MAIRKATQKETEEILKHSVDVFREATLGHVKLSLEKKLHFVSPTLESRGYYLIYSEKKRIYGWIGVGLTYDSFTDEMVGMIPELYVFPEYRKRGIAEKLCREACRKIKEDGYKKMQLNVFSENKAKHLYKKLGFHDVYTMMEKEL